MATFTVGQVLTAAQMNTLASRPAARIYSNSVQTIATGNIAQMTTGITTDFTAGGLTVSTSALVVPTTGIYQVSAAVTFAATTHAGNYLVEIQKNLVAMRDMEVIAYAGSSMAPGPAVSDLISCTANDSLTWWAYQNSGLSIPTTAGITECWLSAVLVSS